MSFQNETDMQFTFTFYYFVRYLGYCEDIPDPNKYGNPLTLPEKWQQIPIICLSLVAFIFNAISLFVFLFGEITANLISASQESKTPISTPTPTITTTTLVPKRGKPKKCGRSRSSFLTSLIILSTFELIFNLSLFIFKLNEVLSPYYIHRTPVNPALHIPPDMTIVIVPVVQNILMFLSDLGLMCRNWCICLITAARAEVVIWPLGSRRWQRILRNPQRFTIIFSIFLVISILIAGFKHADFIGLLCYDKKTQKYGLWSEEYIWTSEAFSRYMSFVVQPYQAFVTWLIIVVFTILILFRLKPWKKDDGSILFPPNSKTLDDIPNMQREQQQHCPVQYDALKRRQQGQMRATRIVLVVSILFGLLECMNFIISICQTAKLLTNHRVSRLLETIGNTLIVTDSICNFLVFISMMSYFRQLFVKIFFCRVLNSDMTSQKTTSCTSINQTSAAIIDNAHK
ncbi:unnamed protein product [Heterobilharzia americana]|nr:unnamed protein product [Heterobilharzia americana]CAH8645313.1 unnamed protein product [Heterobilharzia americana]